LFTLPAGALADMVDRRRLIYAMNIWLAIAAGGLAVCGWMRLLNPAVILIGVFLVGTGFAWNSPAWTAIQPEIVSNDQLPSAATLGGLQLNISGIIGPLIGGLLLRFVDPSGVFAINAVCFLLVIFAVHQVKPARVTSNLPLENFVGSFLSAVRYVRYTHGIQVVLARNILFAFGISVIPALLPVVGLKKLHLDPSGLGMVYTFMGIGSVAAAVFVLPWMRARFHSNIITVLANALVAFVFFLMAFSDVEWLFLIAACLAGAAWTMAASELWVAGQRAMPVWARGTDECDCHHDCTRGDSAWRNRLGCSGFDVGYNCDSVRCSSPWISWPGATFHSFDRFHRRTRFRAGANWSGLDAASPRARTL
jgi:MFS family permease